jgi:cytochrome c-type biogenesis protein
MKRRVSVQSYVILFLEGIITFISPCLLPMLPVYVSYFAGSGGSKVETLKNAVCFVAGFTVVFSLMGAFAGTVGMALREYRTAVNIVSGAVVVILGLNFLGVLKFNISSPFKAMGESGGEKRGGPLASVTFGMAFAVLWTPCVGVFLGSALMIASNKGSAFEGFFMLVCYSAGLGIPFVVCAVLIDMFKSAFSLIKKNYRIVNAVAGSCLVALGVLMMAGYYGRYI